MATNSSFTALPDDVLQRVLLGVARDDHDATAAACRAFRDVIRGPRFLRLRREYGFAERGIFLVGSTEFWAPLRTSGPVEIHVAGNHGAVAGMPDDLKATCCGSTTDGGARLFVSTAPTDAGPPYEIMAVDASSRRWSRVATMPLDQRQHSLEWHGGLLYVAGGIGGGQDHTHRYLNTLYAFNEATGVWAELPPMPHVTAIPASGVVGNELFIAGGRDKWHQPQSTLQIYNFTTRTWRLGAALPRAQDNACGIVVGDGKLYLVSLKYSSCLMVYDVQSNTWTELPGPPYDQ